MKNTRKFFDESISVKSDITIALVVHESEDYISACMKALSIQTIKDVEILMVEDPPFDRTKKIIDPFKDDRSSIMIDSYPLFYSDNWTYGLPG